MSSSLPTVLLLSVVIAGCGLLRTTHEVTLRTDARTYQVGAEVQVRLENDTNQHVGYNLCVAYLSLERQSDRTWEEVDAGLGSPDYTVCTSELRMLRPNSEAVASAHLADDLDSGAYRIVHTVEIDRERRDLRTNVFRVDG